MSGLFTLLIALLLLGSSRAFSFEVNLARECGRFELEWSGNLTNPVSYVVVPLEEPSNLNTTANNGSTIGVPDRIMIQEPTNVSDNPGTFSANQFPLKKSTNFTVTMSDATGFGSGGTSTVQTVKGGADYPCFHYPQQFFEFEVSPKTNWTTCQTLSLSAKNKTDPWPYTYYALSPQSEPYLIKRVEDNNEVVHYQLNQTINTPVSIVAFTDGTNIQFDSGGHITQTIRTGSDVSCIAPLKASPIDTAVPDNTSSSSASNDDSGLTNGETAGVGVGATLGGIALIGAIAAFFILKRKKQKKDQREIVQKVGSEPSYRSDLGDVDMDASEVVTPFVQHTSRSIDGGNGVQQRNIHAPPSIHTIQSSPPIYSKQPKPPTGVSGPFYFVQNHDGTETVTDVPPSYEYAFNNSNQS